MSNAVKYMCTSCIFINFDLYKDENKVPYSHDQISVIQDTNGLTNDMISMKIDTSKELNEAMWLQAKTRGKILSSMQPMLFSVCKAPTYSLTRQRTSSKGLIHLATPIM